MYMYMYMYIQSCVYTQCVCTCIHVLKCISVVYRLITVRIYSIRNKKCYQLIVNTVHRLSVLLQWCSAISGKTMFLVHG